MLRPFAQEEIVVSNVAIGCTKAKYAATGWGNAQKAIVQVIGPSVRCKIDGGTPTASTGFVESGGGSFALESESEIVNFLAIRSGATDSKLIVTYYRKM